MDVTLDRDKWIGGSDEPVILGISPFKTRWELLQEKLNPETVIPFTNEHIEYGNAMEPIIRGYVEEKYQTTFAPDTAFRDHVRYHSDGFGEDIVLEIKTTSQIHRDVHDYKVYLSQILIGMWCHEVTKGILAVYERGDLEFDPFRLQIFEIDINDYEKTLNEVLNANESFWADLEYLKENPLAIESELPSSLGMIPITNDIIQFESALVVYKKMEAELKAAKQRLYEIMTEHGIKSYKSDSGVSFTRVPAGEDKTEEVFDEDMFRNEHPDEWRKYRKSVTRKGKAGYVRVSGIKKRNA